MLQPDRSVVDHSDAGVGIDATLLHDELVQLQSCHSLATLRCAVTELKARVQASRSELVSTDDAGGTAFERSYLDDELDQIAHSRSLERALYYVERLIRSITEIRTSSINDINLNRWKEYDHINTESLWLIDRRDNSGAHSAGYWGNFVPQIPRQMMLRYTKSGDWVLDPFAGSGTTLIEGRRLGRNTVGIELQADVAERARSLIAGEPNPHGVVSDVVIGDSSALDFGALCQKHNRHSVQLVVMHPPYFDIIRFSQDPRDLSNAASIDTFLQRTGTIIEKARDVLDRDRYLALVIGDKYAAGEWIPLGFLTMNEVASRGFLLKSIIVKNFDHTAGKRSQQALWRYRALCGGFYIFKHEYIFVFKKT